MDKITEWIKEYEGQPYGNDRLFRRLCADPDGF